MHNETLNVWSHLLGVLVFVSLILYTLTCIGPCVPLATSDALLARMQLLQHPTRST